MRLGHEKRPHWKSARAEINAALILISNAAVVQFKTRNNLAHFRHAAFCALLPGKARKSIASCNPILVRPPMEFRAGSPADAEAIAGLIASFQSELTDNPSGVGAEQYLASVSVQAERDYLASERYRTFSLTRILNLPGSSPSEMPLTFFISLSRAHISARALLGACGASPTRAMRSWQRWSLYGQLNFSAVPVYQSLWLCSSRIITECAWHLVFAHAASAIGSIRPNQSMKPTAPLRNKFGVFATTPCRGLSLSVG